MPSPAQLKSAPAMPAQLRPDLAFKPDLFPLATLGSPPPPPLPMSGNPLLQAGLPFGNLPSLPMTAGAMPGLMPGLAQPAFNPSFGTNALPMPGNMGLPPFGNLPGASITPPPLSSVSTPGLPVAALGGMGDQSAPLVDTVANMLRQALG